ncbi:hypothetical protein [Bacillus pseudomycoides]|uniref:hypothetical protein n=1 Tax=Bacillus pseudomycoides TaxID=64104 RepID=UPI000BF4BDA7|nr:hypothetical protein [Bacillus pseudomycoides]PFW95202.1 hypothetical protein COL29_09985 [Bacillus pseudomycoides]
MKSKRTRKSKMPLKRIFNESMVRYFHTQGIKYHDKTEDASKHGRRIYWYKITPEFNQALANYPARQ